MSTTPTLTNAEIDEVVYACRQAGDDSTYAIVREAVRRAALTQGAGEAVEPVGWITMWPAMGGGRRQVYTEGVKKPSYGPELDARLTITPVYDAPPAQQLQQAVARALEPVQQAIRDYHYALDTRQHGGVAQGKAVGAIEEALDMHWKRGEELAARAPKGPPCSA